MKIEIWSDVVCPFCYIGKRHLETAIADLQMDNNVEIEWKSFELNPDATPKPGVSIYEALAESKGMPLEQVHSMTSQVVERAAAVGLDFKFDQAVVANTAKSHKLLHFAKSKGLQQPLKERLLHAYFTEGADLNDDSVLAGLAQELGLDKELALAALHQEEMDNEFRMDVNEARQIGISGVPFFVFNRKYAVSGAQPIDTFKQALNQIQTEMNEDAACSVDNPNC